MNDVLMAWCKIIGIPDHASNEERRRALAYRTGTLFLLLALLGFQCACAPQTEVINYRTYEDPQRGMFYIVDGILDKGELISGVGNDQQRVVITRQATQ